MGGAVTERLSGSQRVGYALGSLGTGGYNTVPGLLLLIYLTDNLGVAAGLAASSWPGRSSGTSS